MRTDYGLYVLAIICFIIAGLVSLGTVPQYLPKLETFEGTFITVIFAALGLIFAIVGYSLRPKPIISIAKKIPQAPPPPSPPSLTPAEETTTVPPPARVPPSQPQEEKKSKRKTKRETTRRRRKKA